jgi:hypothetical protein
MDLIKKISGVAAAIGIIILILILIQGIRGCQKTVEKIVSPGLGQEDPVWGKPKAMEIKPKLFGGSEKSWLEVIIPPSADTVRLRIPEGEEVYGLPENAQLEVIKHPEAIIRLKMSFHITGATDFSKPYFGIKLRVMEIWRFGICGYMTTGGPGIGCDFHLVSNVSIGAFRTMDKWCGEVSVRL